MLEHFATRNGSMEERKKLPRKHSPPISQSTDDLSTPDSHAVCGSVLFLVHVGPEADGVRCEQQGVLTAAPAKCILLHRPLVSYPDLRVAAVATCFACFSTKELVFLEQ